MTGFDLGEFPDLIHPIATTIIILAQDSVFEVAGERNAYSSITVAALNESVYLVLLQTLQDRSQTKVCYTLGSWFLFPVEFE